MTNGMENHKMKKPHHKRGVDNVRLSEFISMLAETDEMEMCLSEIWEKTKILYNYPVPGSIYPRVNMGAMKRDIKMARMQGYLIMTGSRSTTKYVKTDLLLKPSTDK